MQENFFVGTLIKVLRKERQKIVQIFKGKVGFRLDTNQFNSDPQLCPHKQGYPPLQGCFSRLRTYGKPYVIPEPSQQPSLQSNSQSLNLSMSRADNSRNYSSFDATSATTPGKEPRLHIGFLFEPVMWIRIRTDSHYWRPPGS